MKNFALYILSVVLLVLPMSLSAYGYKGHEITALIAENYLTQEAAEKVNEILEGGKISDFASWADEVRRDRRNTAPFHYINIAPDAIEITPEDLQQDNGNVYMAVVGYSAILTNPNATDLEKQEALKYIVHFIGDLHQPLHCGYAEDRGGNSVTGNFFGEATNLHRIWDSGIIDRTYGDLSVTGIAGSLLERLNETYTADFQNDTDIIKWVTESQQLLLDNFYPPNHESQEFNLGQDYVDWHKETMNRRLAEAGLRMAATLNVLLADEPEFPFTALTTPLPIEGTDSTQIMPPLFENTEEAESQPATHPTSQPAASQPVE